MNRGYDYFLNLTSVTGEGHMIYIYLIKSEVQVFLLTIYSLSLVICLFVSLNQFFILVFSFLLICLCTLCMKNIDPGL